MLDSMQYWDDPVFELGASPGTWSPVSNEQEAFTMATGVPPHDHYTTLLDTDQDNALMNYFTEAFGEEEHDQNVNYIQHNSNGKSKPQRKMRKDLRRVNQRSAANQRERRRMKTINDAFEGLRDHIPLSSSERKLSKVDTLRLAIRYIQHLGKLLQSYDPLNRMMGMKRNREQTKVIIRCQQWAYNETSSDGESYLYGHSLSWQEPKDISVATGPNNKLKTTLWVPEVASNMGELQAQASAQQEEYFH